MKRQRGERLEDGRVFNPGPIDRPCLRCGAPPGRRCRNVFDVVVSAHEIRHRPVKTTETPYVMPTKAERISERISDHLHVVEATPADLTECPR